VANQSRSSPNFEWTSESTEIQEHSEPHNGTLFGNRVFMDTIEKDQDEIIWI
jgi:hypothetical protein